MDRLPYSYRNLYNNISINNISFINGEIKLSDEFADELSTKYNQQIEELNKKTEYKTKIINECEIIVNELNDKFKNVRGNPSFSVQNITSPYYICKLSLYSEFIERNFFIKEDTVDICELVEYYHLSFTWSNKRHRKIFSGRQLDFKNKTINSVDYDTNNLKSIKKIINDHVVEALQDNYKKM